MTQEEKASKYDEVVAYLESNGGWPIARWVELGKAYLKLKGVVSELLERAED